MRTAGMTLCTAGSEIQLIYQTEMEMVRFAAEIRGWCGTVI